MATTVRETERKYEAVDGVELPGWAGLAGVEGLVGPEDHTLEAVYYDTEDLRLARAGVTLRRRRGGDDAGWHLKLPVGGDSRDEVRVSDARGGRRRTPPAELMGLTRAVSRGAPLAPVAELTTARRRWQLTDDDSRVLVEVVDDHVSAHTLGASTSGMSWREVEVELGGHGDPDLLDRVEERLFKAGVRRSDAGSKLARLLAERLPGRAPAPRLGRQATVGEVVLAYLREQADAIQWGDPAVRQDIPDAVHKMRVATRRMRSALQAYGKVIDRSATRELTDELKWLAGVLGDARDLEVLQARFTHAVAELPDELVVGPVQARLTRFFAGREADARSALIAALDSDRYLALLAAIDRLLADPPLTPRARSKAPRELPALVGRAHRRVAAHVKVADRLPPGNRRDVEWHEARKASKRLRYAAEAAAPALGKPANRLVKQVKHVQELLGDHQDAVVARPVLREIGIAAHLDGENGFTYGLLHQQQTEAGRLHEGDITTAWRDLRRSVGKLAA
ncbi:MAG TPA: CYTH and CHAD domain-containing protein [Pseudonocardiaceae bacterium]|nr:CYTH and CHAD domain-containing protein [Pseudonocardiaceae bacterium]